MYPSRFDICVTMSLEPCHTTVHSYPSSPTMPSSRGGHQSTPSTLTIHPTEPLLHHGNTPPDFSPYFSIISQVLEINGIQVNSLTDRFPSNSLVPSTSLTSVTYSQNAEAECRSSPTWTGQPCATNTPKQPNEWP